MGPQHKKESTGFTQNNCQYVQQHETPTSLTRFHSHYKGVFYNKNTPTHTHTEKDQTTLTQLANGFTKSTGVHCFDAGACSNGGGVMQLHPYVKRSIHSRFPYTDHDTKYTRTWK